MSMSSADLPQPIPPAPRVPSGPERLVKALYNPTYLAILASVGIHGLAVASLPVVGPMINGGQQTPQGPRETQILKLTRAEANRLRSAFPAPKTTALPPGLPSFNPNSTTTQSFSPPPLSGDLSQSKSGRGWASIFGGNPSSETSEAADDSSRVSSTWYTGESEGTSGGSYDYSGESDVATGNGYSYPPDGYPDFSGMVGSPPPNDRSTTDKPPAKPQIDRKAANNGRKPNTPAQNRDTGNTQGNDNNPNSPESELDALVNSATDLGTIPGMRTAQTAVQALEGQYPGLVVRNPDGTVSFAYLGNDPVAEAAIEYTLMKNPSAIPSEPGSYRYDFVYGAPESETTSDVAEDNPTSPAETPTNNSDLLALQEANPDYETLPFQPIAIPSEVSATAQVAVTIDADGNLKTSLIQPTGDPELDQRALEEAQALLDRSSVQTIQTFEIQFNSPEGSPPETEKPIQQQAPESETPDPTPTPEASGELNPESEVEETVPTESSPELESSPEDVEEDLTEKPLIEPASGNESPKEKLRLDQEPELPSLE